MNLETPNLMWVRQLGTCMTSPGTSKPAASADEPEAPEGQCTEEEPWPSLSGVPQHMENHRNKQDFKISSHCFEMF